MRGEEWAVDQSGRIDRRCRHYESIDAKRRKWSEGVSESVKRETRQYSVSYRTELGHRVIGPIQELHCL